LYGAWSDEQLKRRSELNELFAAYVKTLDTMTPELETSRKTWEASLARPSTWSIPRVVSATSEAGVTLSIDPASGAE